MDIGVFYINKHKFMTFGSIQAPDSKTLDNEEKSLMDWYSGYLIKYKDQLQKIFILSVCDAFFSEGTFITPIYNNGFHVISHFSQVKVLLKMQNQQDTKFPIDCA